jgi:mono/diheme cytochrome c family protein
MLRYFFFSFLLIVVLVIALAGFRGQYSTKPEIQIFPDMDEQPRFNPQHPSKFFADGRAARPPVDGTVPLGYTIPSDFSSTGASNNRVMEKGGGFTATTDYYNTGRMGDVYGDGLPVAVTPAVMERGRERYAINCAVCHGATGEGNGIISQYGLAGIANLQLERIRTMPDGQIFMTITSGKNTMGAYGPQIALEDRWAIIAYIRALQRSRNARMEDVPQEQRAQLEQLQQPAKQ